MIRLVEQYNDAPWQFNKDPCDFPISLAHPTRSFEFVHGTKVMARKAFLAAAFECIEQRLVARKPSIVCATSICHTHFCQSTAWRTDTSA